MEIVQHFNYVMKMNSSVNITKLLILQIYKKALLILIMGIKN